MDSYSWRDSMVLCLMVGCSFGFGVGVGSLLVIFA